MYGYPYSCGIDYTDIFLLFGSLQGLRSWSKSDRMCSASVWSSLMYLAQTPRICLEIQ